MSRQYTSSVILRESRPRSPRLQGLGRNASAAIASAILPDNAWSELFELVVISTGGEESYAIRAKYALYSDDEITAGGVGAPGSEPGDASYLRALLDVYHGDSTVLRADGQTGVQDGDVLAYDAANQRWYAKPGGEGGVSAYSALSGKPSINGHGLASGNNTLADLGIAAADHTHSGYAVANHTHNEYLTEADLSLANVKSSDVTDAVKDYANTRDTIKIGYAGASLTNANYFAMYYVSGNQICIKDMAVSTVKSLLNVPSSYGDLSGKPSINNHELASGNNTLSTLGIAASGHNHDSKYASISHTHSGYAAANHDHHDSYAPISHTHNGYAAANHTHSGYASVNHDHDDSYAAISHTHSGYAASNHTHSEYAAADHDHDDSYAAISHTHSGYAASNHTHNEYAAASHDHDDSYAAISHTHSGYAASNHTHNEYAAASHDHDDSYAPISHTHNGYAASNHTHSEYAAANHDHDDSYAAISHTHSGYAASNHTHSEYAAADHDHDDSYAAISHTHSGYAASNHTHSEYAAASHTHSDYLTLSELASKDATLRTLSIPSTSISGYIKIGQAYLWYDGSNGALCVSGENGASMNFYATGDIGAGGSAGGSGTFSWTAVLNSGVEIARLSINGGAPISVYAPASGGNGVSDYSQLSGKPSINGQVLSSGNNSLATLGIASASHIHSGYAASSHTHNEYLPLSCGETKPLSGDLYIGSHRIYFDATHYLEYDSANGAFHFNSDVYSDGEITAN